jgi:hypothetical protein
MADPITLAITGAVAGAALNRKDPLKGALIGGTLGYGGGTALGLGATQAAAPIANAAVGAGSPTLTNLSLGQAGALGSAGAGGPVSSMFQNAVNSSVAGPSAGKVPLGSFGNVGMRTQGFGNTIGTSQAPTSVANLMSPVAPMQAQAAQAAQKAGGLTRQQSFQLNAAKGLLGRDQQQPQMMAPPPMPISRPQGARYPTLEELQRQQMMAQAAPRFSLL